MPGYFHSSASLISVVLALITHSIFRQKEPTPFIFLAVLTVTAITVLGFNLSFTSSGLRESLRRSIVFNATYLGTLCMSVAGYRLSPWHPLARYPGPRLAILSKWWMMHCILIKGGRHKEFQRLHQIYGPWLRIGPNEISVNLPSAIPSIYNNKLGRSNFYQSAPAKGEALITIVDRRRHHERRQVAPFLDTSFLSLYGNHAKIRANQLISHLAHEATNSGEVNVEHWINLFFMDLMGDMGFGGGFETMKAGEDQEGWMQMLAMGVMFIGGGTVGQVPWTKGLIELFPQKGPIETFQKFVGLKVQQIRDQQKWSPLREDIMSVLLDESAGSARLSKEEAEADAGLILVGATDTSVQTVLTVLRHLASSPMRRSRLRDELKEVIYSRRETADIWIDIDVTAASKLPYLDACVQESMRLVPPGPFGPPRTTGSEGAQVVDQWLPPNTTLHAPVYVLHRDPGNFGLLADQYIPERWLPDADIQHFCNSSKIDPTLLKPLNRRAFIPFSAGHASCVGKNLGLQNVKLTIAYIISAFEISTTRGFNEKTYDTSFKEYGLWSHDALKLDLKSHLG
ncbi:cytochrome P450 [Mycena floridula]|nr:cytochrome P450 [Mycena floridula]